MAGTHTVLIAAPDSQHPWKIKHTKSVDWTWIREGLPLPHPLPIPQQQSVHVVQAGKSQSIEWQLNSFTSPKNWEIQIVVVPSQINSFQFCHIRLLSVVHYMRCPWECSRSSQQNVNTAFRNCLEKQPFLCTIVETNTTTQYHCEKSW